MLAPNWILIGFVFCLGVILLTGILIVLVLRRGSRKVIREIKERNDEPGGPPQTSSANTRWARGDLKAAPESPKAAAMIKPCPSCGGENLKSASVCAFCGSKL